MAVKHVKLKGAQETRLKAWLDLKVQEILERRAQRSHDWKKWRDAYEGKTGPKNFPWKGASNVWVPMTAIATDAIHANLVNRAIGGERTWTVQAVRDAEVVGVNVKDGQPLTWSNLADATEDFLNGQVEVGGLLEGVADAFEVASLDTVKLGTGIVYNPWVTLVESGWAVNELGDVVREEDIVIHDGMLPRALPLEDFLVSPHYADLYGPNGAPVFGHMHYLRKGQVIQRYADGDFRARADERVDVLASYGGADEEDLKDAQGIVDGEVIDYTTARTDDFLFQELYVRTQLDDDGPEVRLLVTRHHRTGHLVAIRPWPALLPPYNVLRYVIRDGRFYGIGVPEMLESLQAGINTSFNQTIDNATVANVRGFKVRAGTRAAKQFLDWYPSKKIYVDNMDDVQEFQVGEVYPSAFQVGLLFRDFGERRIALTDYNLGRDSEQLGRAGTATGTLALLQETSRRFDLYARNIHKALGALGMQALVTIAEMRPTAEIYTRMGMEKGQLVERALHVVTPKDILKNLRVISASAATSANKEQSRQHSLTVFGLLVQYLERMFSLAGVMSNPNVPEPIRKLAYEMSQTGERLMKKILEGFEMADISAFLPQLEGVLADGARTVEAAGQQQGVLGGPPAGPEGAQGPMLADPGGAGGLGNAGPGEGA